MKTVDKYDLDDIQTELWDLVSLMTEDRISYDEVKDDLHIVTERLEKIISEHNLWDRK